MSRSWVLIEVLLNVLASNNNKLKYLGKVSVTSSYMPYIVTSSLTDWTHTQSYLCNIDPVSEASSFTNDKL